MRAALDILQSEAKCFLGYLLPTLVVLKTKLINIQKDLNNVKPLTNALLTEIDKRFGQYFDRNEFIVAAMFRLRWVDGDQTKTQYKELTLEAMKEMNSATGLQSNHTSADEGHETPDDDDEDGFFSLERVDRGSRQTNVNSELDMFLNDNPREVTSVAAYPTIKSLFLKYNSGLPSSAPVERVFSIGGQIMTPKPRLHI